MSVRTGEPDKGQAFDILGEVSEPLRPGRATSAARSPSSETGSRPRLIDIFVKKCQEPVVEFALVFPDVDHATLQYGAGGMFTPQGSRRT